MARGRIKILFKGRGYGFIKPDEPNAGEGDVWFHASKVGSDVPFDRLTVGMPVEYELAPPAPRGPQAAFVQAAAQQPPARGASRPVSAYRFLNPYNFVRFLTPPGESAADESLTNLGAVLRAAGVTAAMSQALPAEYQQLLDRCPPPPHDRYVGISGKITCALETVTPLFISDSELVPERGDHKSYQFFKLGGQHALPAASLRGMLRSVFEAVTNSCLSSLTDAQLSRRLNTADALRLAPARVDFVVPMSVRRVAYQHSVADLAPDHNAACNTCERLCPACRVFGWVHRAPSKETERVAYAGRVEFSHGELKHSAGTLPPTPLAILSSPKPTTTRFYLKPPGDTIPEKWTGENVDRGYDGDNRLRGRKFYRHHGTAQEEEYSRAGAQCDGQNRTVRDALRPGARFDFTIRFENLASLELGALLWALEMDQQGFHRLGFAKPLGFGSVKVRVGEAQVLDPAKRYTSLNKDSDGWEQAKDWQSGCVEKFKKALAACYGRSDFESLPNVQDLRALLSDPPGGLPIHYPRAGRRPDPEGRNFKWFLGNNRSLGYTLAPAASDKGLPLIMRDGTEVK